MNISIFSALVGGFTAFIVVFLTHFFTLSREKLRHKRELVSERERWLRDNRQEAYHNTLKYLFKVASVGAKVKNTELIKLPEDVDEEWYSDISEVNAWLTSLHYYCSPEQYDEIGEASVNLLNLSNRLFGFLPTGEYSRSHFKDIISEDGLLDYQYFVDFMNQIISVVSNSARKDLAALDRKIL